jgi:hypothetical protein
MRSSLAAFLSALVFLFSQLLWGQATTALKGTVTDPTGASMPGATVVLRSAETGLTRTTETGIAGEYEFLQIPPGSYKLTVTAAGFAGHERPALRLEVATPATVNISLSLGQPTDVISVQADAAPINSADASLGVAFNESQVKQLPLEGRNVPDLLTLQAGVVYTGNRSDNNRDVCLEVKVSAVGIPDQLTLASLPESPLPVALCAGGPAARSHHRITKNLGIRHRSPALQ